MTLYGISKYNEYNADSKKQAREEFIAQIKNKASEIMEHATLPYLNLDVPLKVEGGQGINWYLAH